MTQQRKNIIQSNPLIEQIVKTLGLEGQEVYAINIYADWDQPLRIVVFHYGTSDLLGIDTNALVGADVECIAVEKEDR